MAKKPRKALTMLVTKKTTLGFGLLLIFFGLKSPALAVSAPQPSITVAPFLQEVKILGSDDSQRFTVTLTNNTKASQQLNLSVVDFGSLNETGGVIFAGNNASNLVKKYGLANWLRLDQNSVNIGPGQSAKITAVVVNDTSLAPGGHYGAIIASLVKSSRSGGNQIGVNQKISSLVFATKLGGEHYDLKFSSLKYNGNRFKLPDQITIRFQNPGNVHVVPRGVVMLSSPNGQVLRRGVINEESGYVLPETFRQFYILPTVLKKPGLWPATYKLKVDYRYDGISQYATQSYQIRYVNPLGILLLLAVIAALVLAAKTLKNGRVKLPKIGRQ